MAFQDFDHISERRKNERRQKAKRKIAIAVVLGVFLVAVVCGGIGAFVVYRKDHGNNNSEGGDKTPKKEINLSQKAIQTICAPTDYKQACESSLTKAVPKNSSATPRPKDLLKYSIAAAYDELAEAIKQTSTPELDTPQDKGALEDCTVLLQDAMEELNNSVSVLDIDNVAKLSTVMPDLDNWLSAVMSYQQTCIDGFPEGNSKTSLQNVLKSTKELTSNCLAIVEEVSTIKSTVQLHDKATARRLLTSNGSPSWMSHDDRRRVLKGEKQKKLTPNLIVAKDGSGNFTTINDALTALPPTWKGRYVIYIKKGIYEEYVTVTKTMVNLTMYGEGSQKTIITGNKNFIDGVRTFQTATFVALGEGFMAQSMGFRNTAGPKKHQAVALRVQSDRSIFLNCRMDGYQDTLYTQTHRQYYRSCLVTGTVDFIFGDAAAVFQNCAIFVRKPLEKQQNTVTAQGRIYKHQTTGIVLQNCRILADNTLEPVKAQFKSYLGRPWKEYSRTIVMESEIGDVIHPDGWMKWDAEFGLKTLFYAEFNNTGAGANVATRVNWPGHKVINKEEAMEYTIGPFIQGDSWLSGLDIPVHFGLF